jgi:hypothetical protein
VVSTLVQGQVWQYLSDGTFPYESWLKYMPRSFTDNWRNATGFGRPTPQDISEGEKNFRKDIEVVGALRRAGGKLADLVLLDADRLEDIRNTQKINAVVFNGRLVDRKALDELSPG